MGSGAAGGTGSCAKRQELAARIRAMMRMRDMDAGRLRGKISAAADERAGLVGLTLDLAGGGIEIGVAGRGWWHDARAWLLLNHLAGGAGLTLDLR